MADRTAAPTAAGWEGLLAPGEQILWQGQPEARFNWSLLFHRDGLSGLFFTAFSLFWISQAFQMTRSDDATDVIGLVFPLFGIPFLLIGLDRLFGTAWRGYARLRSSHYTLTDRNAFIASSLKGKRELQRYDLTEAMTPALEDGSPGSVWFGQSVQTPAGWLNGFSGGRSDRGSTAQYLGPNVHVQRIGFEAIPEARQVFRLLLDARSAAQAAQIAERNAPQAHVPPPPPPPPPPAGG